MGSFKKIICIDFDGVLHSYKSGWQGIDVIPDDPVDGAIEWLNDLVDSGDFNPVIYSSRSKTFKGVDAMKDWLLLHGMERVKVNEIEFPLQKPAAFLTIDDRAICFKGVFPKTEEMKNFKPWNR